MGVDRNVSIGVYLIVEGEKKQTVERAVDTCSNEECSNHKKNKNLDGKFCQKCGSPIKPKLYNEDVNTTPYQAYGELVYEEIVDEDDLCWTDPMGGGGGVWIPNKLSPYEKESSNSKDELLDKYEEVTDLSKVDAAAEIAWFNKEYKDTIDFFKKEFGEESVRIGWGLIEWYS